MDRKNLQDKLDLLSKQIKQIQNEMYSLQEQEDGSNNLVNTPDIPASTSHQSSPQILSVDPLSTPTTVLSQPSQDTRQQSPIPKPSGNYVNIPKTLKLSKITLNDYQFKKRNTTFPDTINDWAIKMMIKRSINNIRDYYRRKGHDNKKVNKVPKKSKNKESADDNNNTNIDQNNGSPDEINETSSDKYKESTRQIDKSDEIADKSDNGKESTEIVETVQKQKAPLVTRAKRKRIENKVNTKNKNKKNHL
ncbi:unnamed protein product [Rhizophagus irregularis]|uniref:Uncharacterized protein n=2 Tax=Rhizophagus irregularis TaxID=588596 RepID=A0A915YW74_9GLOM|nr:unnamed protein product [Rhizophagus irregularis]